MYFPIAVLLILIILIFSNNKILIIKDQANKKAIIKIINLLCFPKKKIVLDLENTHFDVYCSSSSDSEGNALKTFHLYIFNDYKNLVGIDLNKSDIRQRPAKFYYKFFDINNPKDDSLDLKNDR